jgi:hypothetical protein
MERRSGQIVLIFFYEETKRFVNSTPIKGNRSGMLF